MTAPSGKRQLRLMVVDDAPFIREIVRHVAEASGIQLVGEAGDGEEAIEVARATKPDVILMDIIMPRKNGIDATKEILAFDSKVKIIAFSTANQETMVLSAVEAGCCDFMEKPFQAEDLLAIIQKNISKKKT